MLLPKNLKGVLFATFLTLAKVVIDHDLVYGPSNCLPFLSPADKLSPHDIMISLLLLVVVLCSQMSFIIWPPSRPILLLLMQP